MLIIINIFFVILSIYFGFGLLFGIYFIVKGASRIDPLIADSKFKVRLLLAPGAIATWPVLLFKIIRSKKNIK